MTTLIALTLWGCGTSSLNADADSDADTDTDADADTDTDTDSDADADADADADTDADADADTDADADADTDADADADADTDADADADADTDADADVVYVPTPPALLSRGHAWVQHNRPFLTGLTPHVDSPPVAAVERYYDTFGATAAHLWEDGLPSREAGWAAANHPDHRFVSWLRRDGASHENGQIIGGLGADTVGRIGFQVGDEPRNWDQIAEMDLGIDAVRGADPNTLIIVNLGDPHDGSPFADFAAHFAADPDVDILSYDRYSTGYSEYERLEETRAAALSADKPYWRYMKSFGSTIDDYEPPQHSDLRWDAHVGLVYGYTGHSWFVYSIIEETGMYSSLFDNDGTWAHTPNADFGFVAELNHRLENYTTVVSQLRSTEVCFIPVTDVYRPPGTRDWSAGSGGDPFLTSVAPVNLDFLETQDTLIGFFEDNVGESYVMLQNPHRESADWPVWISGEADFELVFDFSGSNADATLLERFDPVSGTVEPLALQVDGPQRSVLNVTLEAGDAILFKYATGSPFARMAPL